jgi:chlorite dismutase
MTQTVSLPDVPLNQGIHVLHLFYRLERELWNQLPPETIAASLASLEAICQKSPGPAHPRVMTFANVGGKADLAFLVYAADLIHLSTLQRDIELAFPPGTVHAVYSYLSVTELPEYVTTDADLSRMLEQGERKLASGTPEFEEAFAAAKKRNDEYLHYRLHPELQDWPIMCFYPMSKKRDGNDNWYSLDFEQRRRLMSGHAKTGRKYAGKISQLITGSTGLDSWEWGVTLMAHRLDDVKNIVHEMRFDEVTARFGVFGPFYINLRMTPTQLWEHLRLG